MSEHPNATILRSAYEAMAKGDLNSATIVMEFADRGAVDAFEAWHAVANVEYRKQFPGAVHEIVDRWVGQEVPGYSRRLG